jgi:hypothetical protein
LSYFKHNSHLVIRVFATAIAVAAAAATAAVTAAVVDGICINAVAIALAAITAITADADFTEALLECPTIDRLNLGPISTMKISWDQPHEGNMFEFLYKRRSIDRA